MRVRTIRAYDELLARALEWQAQGRHYILDAPSHLPVAVQRGWSPQGGGGLSDEDHLRLATISAEVQRALGVALPERALRGERGALLAAQSARHVAVRLSEWVGVCGADYVRQLVGVEPCVLAAPPQALLSTLEALNRHAELEPQDAVTYLLRHPALVGLSPSELEERLEGVAAAVGLAPDEARKMVLERPELLMVRRAGRQAWKRARNVGGCVTIGCGLWHTAHPPLWAAMPHGRAVGYQAAMQRGAGGRELALCSLPS
jgi:hypothetical protein